jgi:glycosyltransferase involved in cell wall biosynthesis
LKLLFLTVIPSPYQRQLFSAIDALEDVDLTVMYFAGTASDREWKLPELYPFERILEGRSLSALGSSTHWNPGVMKEVEKVGPDLIVVSDYSALTAQFVMRSLKKRKIPFVFWGEVPGFSSRGIIGSTVRKQLQAPLKHAAGIAGIGSVAVTAYEALFPQKPIFNIPYFCDMGPFIKAYDNRETQKSSIDILFSGQLIRRKGLDVLISAFNSVAIKNERLRLLILGSGPNRDAYESMVLEELKGRVVFLGHKDPNDLPGTFASADIFCLPSRHDGWGVVVNEALGSCLPIVVSDTTGAAHDLVVDGENGFVTPVEGVQALENALQQIAGDSALRRKMSQASQNAIPNWTVAEGAKKWRDAARKVLSL